jgi:hypothetical protein
MEQPKNDFDRIFEQLSKWRSYPNYQLERRADIFFALYLEKILQCHLEEVDHVDLAIPEFPLLRARLRKQEDEPMATDKLSVKADYLCIDKTSKHAVLVELKTDDSSCRELQNKDMQVACKQSLEQLLEDLILIRSASISKKKYDNLFDEFMSKGFIEQVTERGRSKWKVVEGASEGYTISSVLIKPHNDDENFTQDAGNLFPIPVISFEMVNQVLGELDEPLATSFSKALADWSMEYSRA